MAAPLSAHDAAVLYDALAPGTFRLAKIIATDANEVVCELVTRSFKRAGTFYALSYAWGPIEDIQHDKLLCRRPARSTLSDWLRGKANSQRRRTRADNLVSIKVSPNLLSALHSIRRWLKYPIWIDSICINQRDDVEKATQVPLMGNIFGVAKQVIIWLGSATPMSEVAMETVQWLGDLHLAYEDTFEGLPHLQRRFHTTEPFELRPKHLYALRRVLHTCNGIQEGDDAYERAGLPNYRDPFWSGLIDLYDRPWLTRLWTFQEVLLARSRVVCFGSRTVTWFSYASVGMQLIPTRLLNHRLFPSVSSPEQITTNLIPFVFIINNRKYDVESMLWTYYSGAGRTRSVTKPVDRIYALLATTRSEIRNRIQVDYSPEAQREYWRCYMKATIVLMEFQGLDNVLNTLPSSRRAPQLPSWCPDYNEPPCRIISLNFMFAAVRDYPEPYFRQHPSLENIILVKGVDSDVVKQLYSSRWHMPVDHINNSDVARHAARNLVWLEGIRDAITSVIVDPEEASLAFIETLLGRIAVHKIKDAETREIALASRELEAETLQSTSLPDRLTGGPALDMIGKLDPLITYLQNLAAGQTVDRSRPDHEISNQCLVIILNMMNVLWQDNDTVFFTTTGGRVGFGSSQIRQGDRICVFFGAQNLFVLRQVPQDVVTRDVLHEFVCTAYVRGLMLGEVYESLTSRKEQIFRIC